MLGIIDVREWQAVIDLVTAKSVKRDEEFLQPLQKLAERFPYPGDRDNAGSKWTIEAAEAVVSHYNPGWLFLGFTQPFFSSTYGHYPLEARKSTAKIIFDYILDFAKKHQFYPLILSTGGLIPLKGYIVLPELKGNLQSSAWCHNMAGVYQSEQGDEAVIAQEPHIRSVIKKEDFVKEYKVVNPAFISDFPDYLLIAEDGWHFKGLHPPHRPK